MNATKKSELRSLEQTNNRRIVGADLCVCPQASRKFLFLFDSTTKKIEISGLTSLKAEGGYECYKEIRATLLRTNK